MKSRVDILQAVDEPGEETGTGELISDGCVELGVGPDQPTRSDIMEQ